MRTLCFSAFLVLAMLVAVCSVDGLEDAVGSTRSAAAQQPTAGLPPEETPLEPEEGQPLDGETGGESETDGGASIPWNWIAFGAGLGALGLLLVPWWGRLREARTAQEGEWRDKALDVYSQASAIHDTLRVEFASEGLGERETEAAAQRWRGVERRIADLAVALHGLEASSPDAKLSEPARELLSALDRLRSAGQAYFNLRSPAGDAQLQEAAALARQRLSEFGACLEALKPLL